MFDGSGQPGQVADVWFTDTVRAVGPRLDVPTDTREIDVSGCWVCPGFIDNHTHYDVELEVAPGLSESVRHGVTTVVTGSCGLSMAMGYPEELADMFCRVEGIPRATALPLLERVKDWQTAPEYLDHLDGLALGPNVACLLGHSTLRAHVMGLGRSLERGEPSRAELDRMSSLLDEAIDAGFLGLSVNTLPWDKMDGETYRSRPTPSTFASFSEIARLSRVLRARGALLQALPNLATKVNGALFFGLALGVGRPGLRTALLTMVDAPADRYAFRIVGAASAFANRFLGADIRFQSLPHPFDMYVDGMDVPIMEELGAGTELLHEQTPEARRALLLDPGWRRRFRRQWRAPFGHAYHRDLYEATVIEAPDESLVGRSFGDIADARGRDALETFFDLQAEHGRALRWYTVLANDRPDRLAWIMDHPAAQIGFSDAGAHLRNIAFYNFGLRMLKRVRDSQRSGAPIMSVERAIHRLTGEIGAWLGLDVGTLVEGSRADITVVVPEGLDDSVEQIAMAPIPGVSEEDRLVRRNPGAIGGVWIGGHDTAEGLGTTRMGRVLRWNQRFRNRRVNTGATIRAPAGERWSLSM